MMMNWKGFGRTRLWPYFWVQSRHSPGRTEKNHEKPARIAARQGQDLNLRNTKE
jgi:hypothetical protein